MCCWYRTMRTNMLRGVLLLVVRGTAMTWTHNQHHRRVNATWFCTILYHYDYANRKRCVRTSKVSRLRWSSLLWFWRRTDSIIILPKDKGVGEAMPLRPTSNVVPMQVMWERILLGKLWNVSGKPMLLATVLFFYHDAFGWSCGVTSVSVIILPLWKPPISSSSNLQRCKLSEASYAV